MKIKDLNRKNPSYDAGELQAHQDLYDGGPRLRSRIGDYLPKHEVEPHGAYKERCRRTVYENHLGPLVDGWVGEVFRDPPTIGDLNNVESRWVNNCDGQGTKLAAFWRSCLLGALLHGQAWVLVDLPTEDPNNALRDRADARNAGLLAPYLVALAPSQVLDWDVGTDGQLNFVMFRGQKSVRTGPGQGRSIVYTWTWYDREGWQRWEARPDKDGKLNPEAEATEAGQGLNTLGFVPVVRLKLQAGLWMGRLLKEPAIGLLNAQGAEDWSLYKAAFAVPVFSLDDEGDATTVNMGPGGALILSSKDKYGYLEPSGTSFQALANNVEKKIEGLYRVARQISVSVSNDASRQRASGASKSQDRKPTEIVCGVLGGLLLEAMTQAFEMAAQLSGVPSKAVVNGLKDYEGVAVSDILDEAMNLETVRVPSVTFRAAYMTRLVERVLPGLPQETMETISEELEAGIADDVQREDAYRPIGGGL